MLGAGRHQLDMGQDALKFPYDNVVDAMSALAFGDVCA